MGRGAYSVCEDPNQGRKPRTTFRSELVRCKAEEQDEPTTILTILTTTTTIIISTTSTARTSATTYASMRFERLRTQAPGAERLGSGLRLVSQRH